MKRGGASKKRRLILLLSVGWLPPYLHPSGACLSLGTSVPVGPLHAVEGVHQTGAASLLMPIGLPSHSGLRGRGLDRGLWNVLQGNPHLLSCTVVLRTRTWAQKRSVSFTGSEAPPWQGPTQSRQVHARWPRRPYWPVCPWPPGVGSVCPAELVPSNCCPE